VVGWTGNPDFTEDAFAAFFTGSAGVPRRLNQLAGRVMLHAAVEGLDIIDGPVVRQVLGDLHGDLPLQTSEAPVAAATPEPVVEPESSVRRFVPRAAPSEAPVEPEPAADRVSPAIEARIAALEARVNQQEGALRRVLTLLVDWVEADRHEAAAASVAMAAGASDIRDDHVPIRPPAAWDHAA